MRRPTAAMMPIALALGVLSVLGLTGCHSSPEGGPTPAAPSQSLATNPVGPEVVPTLPPPTPKPSLAVNPPGLEAPIHVASGPAAPTLSPSPRPASKPSLAVNLPGPGLPATGGSPRSFYAVALILAVLSG